MDTSFDAFLDGRFTLEQPSRGPRAAIDALLLASIVPCADKVREFVLDAGCGSAAIALSLATRFPHIEITGIEREAKMAELARRNIRHNKVEKRVSIVLGDLTSPVGDLAVQGLQPSHFSHVVANPPFYRADQSRSCKSNSKSAAHRLQEGELAQWVRFLTSMAAPKASLNLIHRPEALPELLELLEGRFGSLKIVPVYAHANSAAIRILIQGVKGSRGPLSLLSGIVLRTKTGEYSAGMDAVLRHGKRIRL